MTSEDVIPRLADLFIIKILSSAPYIALHWVNGRAKRMLTTFICSQDIAVDGTDVQKTETRPERGRENGK